MSANLVWMDLEMTGLNVERDVILEIAAVVTDQDLNIIAEGPAIAVRQPEETLSAMDIWNTAHHTGSGLLERVRREGLGLREAEARTLAFVATHVGHGESPLCGNSVWQDRRFLAKYMPTLNAHLHYRNVDVSSVKELARRWRPDVAALVKKQGAHLALQDIRESIAELKLYQERFFQMAPPGNTT